MTDRHTEMLLNQTHRSDLDLDIYLKNFCNVTVYMSEFLKRAERTLDPLKLTWLLGTEPGSSSRAAGAFYR